MEKKTLDQLVVGDLVLVRASTPNALFTSETISRRTRTQITAGLYTYTYRGDFHGNMASAGPAYHRRYLQPFDQDVLDAQELSAARKAERAARSDRRVALVARLSRALVALEDEEATLEDLQAFVEVLEARHAKGGV